MIKNFPTIDDFKIMVRTLFTGDSEYPSRKSGEEIGLTHQQWCTIQNIINGQSFTMPDNDIMVMYHRILSWVEANGKSYPAVYKRFMQYAFPWLLFRDTLVLKP
jgi:hypothetical protein